MEKMDEWMEYGDVGDRGNKKHNNKKAEPRFSVCN